MGFGPGWKIVADISTLSALTTSLTDGAVVFVLSVRAPWTYTASGANLTVDGISIASTTNGGATRWVRQDYSDVVWRIQRDAWYIDPVNGNDEQTGLTSLTAIKTGAELARRWGSGNLVTQSGSSSDFGVHIYVLGDIVAPDYLQVDCVVDDETEIYVQGTPTTIVASPAGATAITPQNHATNTPWSLTDAVTSPSLAVGQRIRWTAGAASGGCAWIAKSLGGNSWRFSQPQLSGLAAFNLIPTSVNPSTGDAYVVEQLTSVSLGIFSVQQLNTDDSFFSMATFQDCAITQGVSDANSQSNWGTQDIVSMTAGFDQCSFEATVVASQQYFSNCCYLDGFVGRGQVWLSGGLGLAGPSQPLFEWNGGSDGRIGLDLLIQGTYGLLMQDIGVIGDVGIFDTLAGFGGQGDGCLVGEYGSSGNTSRPASVVADGVIWGAGNAGAGVRVRSGCKLAVVATPTIVGTGTDFQLGAGGQARAFDETTGVYTAVVTETWAHFAASVGAGGFGGNAHNLTSDAHLLALA